MYTSAAASVAPQTRFSAVNDRFQAFLKEMARDPGWPGDCIPYVSTVSILSRGLMKSSGIITLFSEPPAPRSRPSPFLASILLHCAVMGLVWFGLHHVPKVHEDLSQRYTVKILKLNQRLSPLQWQPRNNTVTSEPARIARSAQVETPAPARQSASGASGGTRSASELARAPRLHLAEQQIASLISPQTAPQTIVQPDLPQIVLPQRILAPQVVLWFPRNTPVKMVIPPPRQELTASNVHPSLATPNEALLLANLKISPGTFATNLPTLPPSTVSPIAVKRPAPVQQVPQTSSVSNTPPTPVRVLSLSNVQLENGAVALPPVNEVASASGSKVLADSLPAASPFSGAGSGAGMGNRSATGKGSGEGKGSATRGAGIAGATGRNSSGSGIRAIAASLAGKQGASSDAPPGDAPGSEVTRIERPKGGQFGFVVIGSTPSDLYPEAPDLWAGRLAYTVYLHVGLPKSWLLEYSLPRPVQAAHGGEVAPPKAPWPYLIVRPHLAPGDLDADAIMIHGFVSTTGRFEKLSIAFPQPFSQAKFVLNALEQWKFRPATENGQPAEVEILLIIPEDVD